MKAVIQVLLMVLAVTTMAGCQSISNASSGVVGFFKGSATAQFAAKQAVQRGVWAYIDQDPATAQRVVDVTESMLVDLEGDLSQASISVIAAALRSRIEWGKLHPMDAQALNDLINAVEVEIRTRIEMSEVPPDTVLIVTTVLSWANETGRMALGGVPLGAV